MNSLKTIPTVFTLAAATSFFALLAPIQADDKDKQDKNTVEQSTTTKANLEKAQQVVRDIQQPEVKASTGTATAQQISKEQNAVEQAHQKEVSQKAHLDKDNVPAPTP